MTVVLVLTWLIILRPTIQQCHLNHGPSHHEVLLSPFTGRRRRTSRYKMTTAKLLPAGGNGWILRRMLNQPSSIPIFDGTANHCTAWAVSTVVRGLAVVGSHHLLSWVCPLVKTWRNVISGPAGPTTGPPNQQTNSSLFTHHWRMFSLDGSIHGTHPLTVRCVDVAVHHLVWKRWSMF